MKPARWLIPLLAAAVLDAGLIVRYEASPGMQVSRAVLRTIDGGGCQEAVLVRGNDLDSLSIVDSWLQNDHLVSVPSNADFAPGAGLTPQSLQYIREGVDVSALTTPVPATTRRPQVGVQPLLSAYRAEVGAGDSWLHGPCLPYANPFESRLHPVGFVSSQGVTYRVFAGDVQYARGGMQFFPDAQVWIGILPDGRLGFEMLKQQPSKNFNPAISVVATRFTYPKSHTDRAIASQAPSWREAFYLGIYANILTTIASFQTVTGG